MQTWLIYEPPGGALRSLDDAERFVSFREGFSKLAFLAPVIWLIWRRCWGALALYIAVEIALLLIARGVGLNGGAATIFALLPNVAVGFEAAWLRARALERRGYGYAGSLLARSREEAEAHFFAEWLDDEGAPRRPAASLSTGAAPYRPAPSGVLGLFPQPGAAR